MEETPLSRTGRAWREVDGKALAHNARLLQGLLAPGCRLMAVVKAEAYGHGAVWAARTLRPREWTPSRWPACPRGSPSAGRGSPG